MKCKILETPIRTKKAEPIINERLAGNSHLNIKFIQELVVGNMLRIRYYYKD